MCKKPVTIPLVLTKQGFEGDGVGDLKHHGGSDKAVCVYVIDHYEYWEKLLGRKMPDAATVVDGVRIDTATEKVKKFVRSF
jgi:MOSC domain-containing protein YiiM